MTCPPLKTESSNEVPRTRLAFDKAAGTVFLTSVDSVWAYGVCLSSGERLLVD